MGDELWVDVPVFVYPDTDKTVERYSTELHLDCRDIGVAFTTALYLSLGDDPPGTLSISVSSVAEGSFTSPFYVQRPNTMMMWRRKPLRAKLRNAAGRLFLVPGEPMRPLRPRIGEAWREIFPPKQQSYLQRLRLALRVNPDGYPTRFGSEWKHVKGGPIMRRLRRLRIRIALMVNTFLKRREGF